MAWIHPPAIGCRFSFLHIPCGRCGHTMCVYQDSQVLFGGFDGKKWLNDLHILDMNSLVWTQPKVFGPSPQPRQYHTAEIIGNTLYIFGGYNGSAWLSDLITLDFDKMTWQLPKFKGDCPSAREGHSMCAVGKYLYLYGGWDGSALSDLYRLDTQELEWVKLEVSGPKPFLCGHSMTYVKDQFYLFGGFDGNNWVNNLYTFTIQDTKITCNKPRVIGVPVPRGYHSATLVNRYILIYAGYNGKYILGDLVALDTETFTWSVPDPCSGHFPAARNAHTMTLYGSELYMFGGYNGSRDTNELHVLETSAFSSLHDDLREGYHLDLWKDVKLVAHNGFCMIHSLILKSRCPILYSCLIEEHPDFLDLRARGVVAELEVGTCMKEGLSLFCEYLYSDLCTEQLGNRERDDLLYLAIRYDLPRLRGICFNSSSQIEGTLPDSMLAKRLKKSRKFEDLSDLTIVVEESEFKVHKIVMASRCPYFKAMLHSGMMESLQDRVVFNNFSANAFDLIVEWIYSDRFSPLFANQSMDLELGVNLLTAANMLNLQSLMRMTEIALEKLLDCDNVMTLYEISFTLGAQKLKSYCINLILRDFDRISMKK